MDVVKGVIFRNVEDPLLVPVTLVHHLVLALSSRREVSPRPLPHHHLVLKLLVQLDFGVDPWLGVAMLPVLMRDVVIVHSLLGKTCGLTLQAGEEALVGRSLPGHMLQAVADVQDA